MARTARKETKTKATPGFAIEIKGGTNLGIAMLIAEDEEGRYEPVASVVSVDEGREIAQSDLARRMRLVERDQDAGICPYYYKIWAAGIEGSYCVAAQLLATDL